jgi:hypothetical protein
MSVNALAKRTYKSGAGRESDGHKARHTKNSDCEASDEAKTTASLWLDVDALAWAFLGALDDCVETAFGEVRQTVSTAGV